MSDLSINTEISIEDATNMFGQVQGRVFNALTQRGFSQPTQPAQVVQGGGTQPYNGYLPPDLTKLRDDELGYYLGMLSSWLDYVQVQLAEAHMNLTTSEKKLELIEAKLYMLYKVDSENKKRTETERKSMVISDRRYVEAQTEALYHETYHRYVRAIVTGAEQNYAAVSRRISQRQQDVERNRRGSNVGNVQGPFFQQPQHR